MKIIFLGTSAGKPTVQRGTSALGLELEQDSKWYLFDCGEGTQRQIMQSNLKLGRLSAIFITHMHGDHYYGLPGLLSTKKLDNDLTPISLYVPKGIKQFLEITMDIDKDRLGYELNIVEYEMQNSYIFDKFSIKILPLIHSEKSCAFYIKEHDITNKLDIKKLKAKGLQPSPLYGKIQRGENIVHNGELLYAKEFYKEPIKGRKIIIAGDNEKPDILGEYLSDLDLLVHECTYTQDIYDNLKTKHQHTIARELGIVAQRYGVKNLIANHLNPRFDKNKNYSLEMVYDEIKENYKASLFLANDFDTYKLDNASNLSLV
jgi:ribonuclease Z